MDVPVQYYQSIIAVELATAGALLFQIRFFAPRGGTEQEGDDLPDPRLRVLMAVIIGATLFGSLAAMLHERESRRHSPSPLVSPCRYSPSCSADFPH